MNNPNISRYSRQTTIPSFGIQGQEKLSNAAVLVVGAGGLGSPVLLYLVAAGVRKIGIVEHDSVALSNLQRQVLFTENDIAKPKIYKAHSRLKAMNSATEFILFEDQLVSENAIEIAKDFDLLIDCTDNFPTRYLVNDVCELLRKPFVYGALFRFEGQVAVFNHKGGATYRDLFLSPPNEEMAPNCESAGILGSVAGIVGTIMATEAIKVLTGVGEPLKDKLLVMDTLSMDFRKIKILKNPNRPKVDALIDYKAFCGVSEVQEIDWETYRLMSSDFSQVIDVRSPIEYQETNLGFLNIPLDEIVARKNEVLKDGKVLVYCQMGGRSKKAISLLKSQGFNNLVSLKGGLNAATASNPEE